MRMRRYSIKYPKRGDIFVADLNLSFGHEIHKKRPVLVVSNNILNKELPTVIIIPLSSIIPQFIGPDVVRVGLKAIGLHKESLAMINHIRSIDKKRLVGKIGTISKEKLKEVEEAIKIVLDLREG